MFRPCEAEEADQCLVRHTLNLINNGYKNILAPTIDADVLVLLISYIRQVELNDIEIHAYLLNLDRYYNIKQIIRELGSDISLALPSFILSLDVILFSVFMVRVSETHIWVKSERKDDFTDVFVELRVKPTDVTSQLH